MLCTIRFENLCVGGAYMPLDVSYPRSLLADIFTDAEPPCIIVNQTTAKKLSGEFKYLFRFVIRWYVDELFE